MNYYGARRRKADGIIETWDFTCMNDGHVWPVGYCAGWPTPNSSIDERINAMVRVEMEKLTPHKAKFHTDGHVSPEAAQACYRRYLLDTRTRFDTQEHSQRKCEAFIDPSHTTRCGKWTQGIVFVDEWFACICDDHRTQAAVAELFPEVGTITSS